jgi:hypothetical protein
LKGGFLARLRGTQRQTNAPPLPSHLSHCMAHRLGWNRGTVVAATDCAGMVWVGFRCVACGRLSFPAPAYGVVLDADRDRQPPDEAFT